MIDFMKIDFQTQCRNEIIPNKIFGGVSDIDLNCTSAVAVRDAAGEFALEMYFVACDGGGSDVAWLQRWATELAPGFRRNYGNFGT